MPERQRTSQAYSGVNFRTLATAAHATRDDVAVRFFLANHNGPAAIDAPGRQVVTVIDATTFDVTALIAVIIRPNADVRTVGADAELHLSR
jgi:hypothetical protein